MWAVCQQLHHYVSPMWLPKHGLQKDNSRQANTDQAKSTRLKACTENSRHLKSSCLLICILPEPWWRGGGLMEKSHLEPSALKSLALCTSSCCALVSMFIPVYCKKLFLWCGLIKVQPQFRADPCPEKKCESTLWTFGLVFLCLHIFCLTGLSLFAFYFHFCGVCLFLAF